MTPGRVHSGFHCYHKISKLPANPSMMPPLTVVEFNTPHSFDASVRSDSTLVSVNKRDGATKTAKPSTSRATAKKSVQFKQSVKVRKISSHKLYSDEERESMWYSQGESKKIRANAVSTVKKMMRGIDVDKDENDCSRGLEYKTPKRNKVRQQRKSEIMWTILGEQEAYFSTGRPVDEERLASLYIACTRVCAREAATRGSLDALAAKDTVL